MSTSGLPPPPPPNIHNPSLLRRCIVTKICVRDGTKPRNFAIDESVTEVLSGEGESSWRAIVEDDSIDVVVEVMGGVSVAREIVMESLRRGKSVVTANKGLVAECMDEIRDLVLQSGGRVKFGYEAAVCGGIPIINSLQGCFAGDLVNEVMVRFLFLLYCSFFNSTLYTSCLAVFVFLSGLFLYSLDYI